MESPVKLCPTVVTPTSVSRPREPEFPSGYIYGLFFMRRNGPVLAESERSGHVAQIPLASVRYRPAETATQSGHSQDLCQPTFRLVN
jgi:hypothetical protein